MTAIFKGGYFGPTLKATSLFDDAPTGRLTFSGRQYKLVPAPERSHMTDRIRFISHEGKQILLVDFSNCSARDVEKVCRAVPELVTTLPRNSALIVSDFTGASFDKEAIQVMKEAAVFDKPHVRKSAWVGAENFPHAFLETLRSFSRRDFPAFKTREEALAWLAKDE
jgi:hypothetical protein